jgi:hypothetical protein
MTPPVAAATRLAAFAKKHVDAPPPKKSDLLQFFQERLPLPLVGFIHLVHDPLLIV